MSDGSITEGSKVIVHSRVDENQTWTGTVTKIDRENAKTGNNNMYSSSGDGMTQSSSYPFYVQLAGTNGLMLGQHVYVEPDVGQQEVKTGMTPLSTMSTAILTSGPIMEKANWKNEA